MFLRCNIISMLSKTAYLISAVLIDDRKPSRDMLTHSFYFPNPYTILCKHKKKGFLRLEWNIFRTG